MSQNTIIQVPVAKSFRDEMVGIANDLGFSSLQDLIRFTLTQIKKKLIIPTMTPNYPTIKLSAKNAARYDKMSAEMKAGKNKSRTFDNVDDVIKYLES
jgi:hypothetical protein